MLSLNRWNNLSWSVLLIGCVGIFSGLLIGFLAGANPLILGVILSLLILGVYLFTSFDYAILSLLVIRSTIDYVLPLPTFFAIAINVLTIGYVIIKLFTRKAVYTDGFWWFFASWWLLQGLWVLLLPLGGLGDLDTDLVLSDSTREWTRLFSWVMIYLLIMQFKDRFSPERIISILFFSLALPILIALLQMVAPSVLPAVFSPDAIFATGGSSFEGSRIRGTFGHPNGFTTYLFLFIGLTWWKLQQAKRHRFLWILLLGSIAFFYVGAKALFSLMMLAVLIVFLIAPRLNIPSLIGGILFLVLVIGLFASSEFGQSRIGSIANTPLLNPDIDVWKAILLSKGDNNSFNWRVAQWTMLLGTWQQHPILGSGLATAPYLSSFNNFAHNEYVRALSEQGIIGLGVFLGFFAVQAQRLVRLIITCSNPKQSSFCFVLLAIQVGLLVGMATENVWTHTMLFYLWWTLFAVAGWDWSQPHKSLLGFTSSHAD